VLVRTYQATPAEWDSEFHRAAPATLELLHDRGVRLIGIDTPSLDPEQSKSLDSHQVVRRHNNGDPRRHVLDSVAEGDYELIALPLKCRDSTRVPCARCCGEL